MEDSAADSRSLDRHDPRREASECHLTGVFTCRAGARQMGNARRRVVQRKRKDVGIPRRKVSQKFQKKST